MTSPTGPTSSGPRGVTLTLPTKVLAFAGGLLAFAGVFAILGAMLMVAWGLVMPAVFGLPALTFTQAYGMMFVVTILTLPLSAPILSARAAMHEYIEFSKTTRMVEALMAVAKKGDKVDISVNTTTSDKTKQA